MGFALWVDEGRGSVDGAGAFDAQRRCATRSRGSEVDDAIVVVENIHRHRLLHPDAPIATLIPAAVDEVGGPTILATFTVIAALLPMAFVTGLMGPYMSPIPINASMGMLLSLAIAFVVTPWLARLWMKQHSGQAGEGEG